MPRKMTYKEAIALASLAPALLDSLENLRSWVGSLAVTGYAGNVPPEAWHQLTLFCDKADTVITKARGE